MNDDSEDESDEALGTQARQNGVPIHTAERCAILYDRRHQCIHDDPFRQQQQQHAAAPHEYSRMASLCLSKPAFVVRSLREVLEPGELSTAWRSAKEGSFSCYNRNVFVGVRRLQRGGVTAHSEDVKFYSADEERQGGAGRAGCAGGGGGSGGDHLPPFVGYDGYFSKEDFEEFLAEESVGAARVPSLDEAAPSVTTEPTSTKSKRPGQKDGGIRGVSSRRTGKSGIRAFSGDPC